MKSQGILIWIMSGNPVCSAQVEWEKYVEPVRHTPFINCKSQNILVTYDLQLISYASKLRQFHAVLQPEVVFQKLKYVLKFHI